VTPMLVDRWSGGDPDQAGRAYAVNVVGCIVGPLIAGFLLLPVIGERLVLIVFSLPWIVLGMYFVWGRPSHALRKSSDQWIAAGVALVSIVLVFATKPYEDRFTPHEVLRDNTATIIATGTGMKKQLLVNGVGITFLTPITKLMAHMPLAFLEHPPKNALVVCFGMGTTYRSLMSWNIPVTAVELVPSVPKMFWYYHPDGPEIMKSPLSNVVIDDGRRYLERTNQQYDVITIDPPPPVEAAGSSLLYSKEFYTTIKQRLRPDGVLQQWLPEGDPVVHASVARAIKESFPYVRVYHSIGGWGYHFLAATHPLPEWTPEQLVQHMPAAAVKDLIEWGPEKTPERQFANILGRGLTLDEMIAEQPNAPALQDDRPLNEYYTIRRKWLKPRQWHLLW
jgi:spermidine synthase